MAVNRDELKDKIGAELASLGSTSVTDVTLDHTLEQIMGLADSHASTERRRTLRWAVDECRREARWLLSAKAGAVAVGTASKLAGVFKAMADIEAQNNSESSGASS